MAGWMSIFAHSSGRAAFERMSADTVIQPDSILDE
jgi:hypothetical protein